jgi:predicted MPP superfamily phosphohydrolase
MGVTASSGKWGGWRCGLATAAALVLYVVLVRVVTMPLHAAGFGQPVLGCLNGLGWILLAPGLTAARLLGAGYSYTPRAWLIGLALNVPLYFLLGVLGRALWPRRRPAVEPAAPAAPAAPSRRRFLTTGLRLVGGGAAAGLAYGFVEPHWYTVTRRTVPLRGLPPSLDGLRLVQLTDLHHGPWLSLGHVRDVVRACNALRPDLVLLTGDYILYSSAYARPVVEELTQLRPTVGTLAVLGNHDWGEGGSVVQREFVAAGLSLIDNARRVLTPDRELVAEAGAGLALCGVDDLWRGRPDPRGALAGLPAGMPRLLLSHNPDVAEEPDFVRSGLRVDLMISGHTHGGQVYVPGFGTPFVPSRYGQKYARGLVQGPACPVFVCRGIGMATVPVRLGVPPEIAVLELRCEEPWASRRQGTESGLRQCN